MVHVAALGGTPLDVTSYTAWCMCSAVIARNSCSQWSMERYHTLHNVSSLRSSAVSPKGLLRGEMSAQLKGLLRAY